MGHILGALGGLLVGLIVLGAAAAGLYTAFSKSNVASTEENLVIMRMQIQQFYSGTNYDNLDNETAIKAGLIPKPFLKNNSARNSWGGDITLSSDSSVGQFSISLANVPQEECTQLARFQTDAWEKIEVNGSEVDSNDPSSVVNSCTSSNTVTYTAR